MTVREVLEAWGYSSEDVLNTDVGGCEFTPVAAWIEGGSLLVHVDEPADLRDTTAAE